MKAAALVPAAILVSALSFAAGAALQEGAMPGPAEPGPEHELLGRMVGEWTTTTHMMGMQSKGKQTFELDLGGLWLVGRLEGEFMGQPFSGMSILGWDAAKEKYVGVWVDSFTAAMQREEGHYDAEQKRLDLRAPSVNPMTGEPVVETHRWEFNDDGTLRFSMLLPDEEGGEYAMFHVDYTK